MEPTLVIMAAGMGSRYGGDKQTDGVGPKGEMLMEYSIFDAMRAGFTKVVFIIKPELREMIDNMCGIRLRGALCPDGSPLKLEYVYQEMSDVPDFYSVPKARVKPFGTVHALRAARHAVSDPFVVINADDYYGAEAFSAICKALKELPESGEGVMVGYYLKNTVSEHGTVTRGVCTERDGFLSDVVETFKIKCFPNGEIKDMASSEEGTPLDPDSIVSMNFWGFAPSIFPALDDYLESFLRALPEDELKAECLLPMMVDEGIKQGRLSVSVLHTDSRWFGMTYHEDRAIVAAELKKLHEIGVYPSQGLRD